MYPTINVMGFSLPTYSLMVAIGFAAYLIYLYRTFTREQKVSQNTLSRLLIVSFVGFAILGVSALVLNSLFHSIEEKRLVIGGITWLGGVLGAFPAMVFLLHRFVPEAKGRALYFFSLIIPGIVLAHAFGRMGCFFAGCCHGAETDAWYGVNMVNGHEHLEDGTTALIWHKVVPTQLYEALFEFALFLTMVIGRKKWKKYNIEIYCIAYGVFRFIMEFFRGDDRGGTGFFLTPSQLMCILLWIAATLLILYRRGVIFKGMAEKCEKWRAEARALQAKRKLDHRCCVGLSSVNVIRELHKLKEEGIISEAEFEQKKDEILRRI